MSNLAGDATVVLFGQRPAVIRIMGDESFVREVVFLTNQTEQMVTIHRAGVTELYIP